VNAPSCPPLHGASHAFFYHLGSILVGAFLIPWCRWGRMAEYVLFGELPGENDNKCCQCIGSAFKCIEKCICACRPTCCDRKSGSMYIYNKNAYMDIIIRSNFFETSAPRANAIISSNKHIKEYVGALQIVSFLCTVSIGTICAIITYTLVTSVSTLSDPRSGNYIYDPMMVSLLAFFLSGMIGYGFMMLIDHSADCLLYCFAWNRKMKKSSLDKYIPESLREIVGYDDQHHDSFPFYGRANPNMYLGTWFSAALKGGKHHEKKGDKGKKDKKDPGKAQKMNMTAPVDARGSAGPSYQPMQTDDMFRSSPPNSSYAGAGGYGNGLSGQGARTVGYSGR